MTQDELDGLVAAIKAAFSAEVEIEQVDPKGRYRLGVVSASFEGMTQLQRQDAIWDLVDTKLSREASLDVSLILAYTPSELASTE